MKSMCTRPLLAEIGLLALLLSTAACGTPPTRFYTLMPVEAAAPELVSGRKLVVGLEPVVVPAYLDRPQIVTRSSPTQIKLGEFDLWAEPLGGMTTQVLAESIFRLAPVKTIMTLPQQREMRLDRVVDVVVRRFDCDAGSMAMLEADWRIFDRNDRQIAGSRFQAQSPISGSDDYSAMVSGMSHSLGLLAQEIAEVLATTARD
jgi:uncharacterized protein